MKIIFQNIVFGIILAIILFSGACKVSYTMSGADICPEAKTISVKYFQNYAPIVHPTLSQDITEAVRKRFESQTPLNLISGVGDLHFEGEIVGYDIKPVDIQGNELASKNRLTIKVKVRYTNTCNSDNDFDTEFSRYKDYDAQANFDDVADNLNKQIIEVLTEDIFNKAVVNW